MEVNEVQLQGRLPYQTLFDDNAEGCYLVCAGLVLSEAGLFCAVSLVDGVFQSIQDDPGQYFAWDGQ